MSGARIGDPDDHGQPTLTRATLSAGGDRTAQTAVGNLDPVVPDDMLERGQSVGRYVIYDLLGAGGMGAVYRAYDPELNRGVALKMLTIKRRRGADPSVARARLEREAQAMAQLSHPNVVAIHDVGRHDDDLFIAMELVEGQTLKQWRKAAPRSQQQILFVFRAAGRGLSAAHRAGMVHRDFKPDNVLVGDDGRVRVADFGLARGTNADDAEEHVAANGDGDRAPSEGGRDWVTGSRAELTPSTAINTPLTQVGAILGTPAYMAPEQYLGTSVDASSDQFCFCVALYEALYGERPFAAKNLGELRRNVLAGEVSPPPPGAKVPGWLRKVLLRGLSVSSPDRFPSMEALLEELGRDPVRARRRRAAIAIAAVGFIALGAGWLRSSAATQRTLCTAPERWLVGVWDDDARASFRRTLTASEVGYASATADRVENILDDYAQQWSAAHTQTCEATHIHGTQSDRMFDLRMKCLDRSNLRVTSFVRLMRDELDEGLIKNAVKAAIASTDLSACSNSDALLAQDAYPEPSDPDERARVATLRQQIDEMNLLLVAGRFQEGVDKGDALVAEADALGYAPAQAHVRLVMGGLLRNSGRAEGANDVLAAGLLHAARAGDQASEALLHSRRIWVLGYLMGRYDTALALVPVAEAAIARAGDTPQLRQELADALGAAHYAKGHFDQARSMWERRIELMESVSTPLDPAMGWAHNNLSAALLNLRDYEPAIRHLERAREIWGATLGPKHPAMGALLTNLGIAYKNSERLEEAIDAQRRALEVFERVHGPNHHQVSLAANNLGASLERAGDLAGAERLIRRALAISERQAGPATHHTAVAYAQVGGILFSQEKYAEAATYHRRAVETFEATVGRDDIRTGLAYRNLGLTLVRAGDTSAGVAAFEQSLALLSAGESPLVPEVQFELAKALWNVNAERKRARRLAKTARAQLSSGSNTDTVRAIDAWLGTQRAR